jgi:hypothetical protein
MQYMLLICDDETTWGRMSEEELGSLYQAYGTYTNELREKGVYVDGAQLQPVATATTVRVDGDSPVATDGPFAETKEQLGGYFVVDCDDIDQAIALAARIPAARHGSVEVRPLVDRGAPA